MLSCLRQSLAWKLGRLCALLITLSACGGGGSEPSVPANIALNSTSLSFTAVGETQQLFATVTDRNGNRVDATVTWSSSNPEIASVTSAGLVTSQASGSTEVTATAGSASSTAQVAVTQTPAQLQRLSGEGGSAVAGQSVTPPPAVLVQDANNHPVAGVPVTFAVLSGNGRVTGEIAVTDNSGIAQVSSWQLGSKGSNTLSATAAGSGITGNPATFTATGTSSFNIVVQFVGTATQSQRAAFAEAQNRWESLIVGDLTDVALNVAADECAPGLPAVNQMIDDLLILVSVEPIDGPGEVLGSAGPCFVRTSNDLTVLGGMTLDTDDLEAIEAEGLLTPVIIHEMGHVIGFGSLWGFQGLLADASLPPNNGTDPHFTGAEAIAAFNEIGGASYGGNKVPVENSGGEGLADGHWRESVFTSELMTGLIGAAQNPLSVVSVASFADQGYTVNRIGADPFSLSLALRATIGRPQRELRNDLLRVPIRRVDGAGRVVRQSK